MEAPQAPAQAAPPPLPQAAPFEAGQWQHLPPRGTRLAGIGGAIGFAIPGLFASGLLARLLELGSPWILAPIGALVAAAFGAWLAVKRHRRTLWKLDAHGFALRRGRWFQSESQVPISRVQHLDLKRGPLERAFDLATLVVHTAGTRMAAVSVSGLDGADAERLRDRLARQLDHDDDAL